MPRRPAPDIRVRKAASATPSAQEQAGAAAYSNGPGISRVAREPTNPAQSVHPRRISSPASAAFRPLYLLSPPFLDGKAVGRPRRGANRNAQSDCELAVGLWPVLSRVRRPPPGASRWRSSECRSTLGRPASDSSGRSRRRPGCLPRNKGRSSPRVLPGRGMADHVFGQTRRNLETRAPPPGICAHLDSPRSTPGTATSRGRRPAQRALARFHPKQPRRRDLRPSGHDSLRRRSPGIDGS